MKRHILLVGLPGAGKTSVGRLVAEKLGTVQVDADALIVRKMQMPVNRIFAEHGEPRFRQVEGEVMQGALAGAPTILTPGGGWIAQPGAIEAAREAGAFIVYLKTMALTASKRAGDGARPMLVGEDPVERMRQLLKEREPVYSQADVELKADVKSQATLADEIVALAREKAGW
jgi:shikimate kinase